MNYSDPIIDGYYDYCLSIKKLKQTSVNDIRCSVNKLQQYLSANEIYEYIWNLELSIFVQFFSGLREKGERGTGISKQVSHLRSFVDYCWRAEYCNKNPLIGFSIKDNSPQYQPRFLTIDEVSNLISSTDRKTRLGRKERLIVLILYGLGLRTSELCGIKIKDISIDEQDLFVKGKFDIERRIPIPDGVWVELPAYLHEADLKRGLLFRTEHKKRKLSVADVGVVVKKYSAFAKLESGVTPKSLRHTFASHLIGEGIDISVISMLMGHKSPKETGSYLHAYEKDVRAAAFEFDKILEDELWNGIIISIVISQAIV